jgi:hypothetical protein
MIVALFFLAAIATATATNISKTVDEPTHILSVHSRHSNVGIDNDATYDNLKAVESFNLPSGPSLPPTGAYQPGSLFFETYSGGGTLYILTMSSNGPLWYDIVDASR